MKCTKEQILESLTGLHWPLIRETGGELRPLRDWIAGLIEMERADERNVIVKEIRDMARARERSFRDFDDVATVMNAVAKRIERR